MSVLCDLSNLSFNIICLVGKDNLPLNRYCPREIPTWQKKITFFYDKNAQKDESKGTTSKSTNFNNNIDAMPSNSISSNGMKRNSFEMEQENMSPKKIKAFSNNNVSINC